MGRHSQSASSLLGIEFQRCTICKTSKNLRKFPDAKHKWSGKSSWCRDCSSKATCARNSKHPDRKERNRKRKLRCFYDMSIADFDKLVEKQSNKCAICSITFTEQPNIDHNHRTGKVRGLLCRPCNLGIGLFADNPDKLEAAVNYLLLND